MRRSAALLSARADELAKKRLFDLLLSGSVFLLGIPLFLLIAAGVKLSSPGPVFFRQKRIGQFGVPFTILKFRTMVQDAERRGVPLTLRGDGRITPFGKLLRNTNLDEMPQLLNVLKGEMSLVGTRPEVPRYVREYTDAMLATLLLPPGMLSEAGVRYRRESELLGSSADPERLYLETILPDKMKSNLRYLEEAGIGADCRVLLDALCSVFQKGEGMG